MVVMDGWKVEVCSTCTCVPVAYQEPAGGGKGPGPSFLPAGPRGGSASAAGPGEAGVMRGGVGPSNGGGRTWKAPRAGPKGILPLDPTSGRPRDWPPDAVRRRAFPSACPPRALVLSRAALSVPVAAALLFPDQLGQFGPLVWLLALVPALHALSVSDRRGDSDPALLLPRPLRKESRRCRYRI